MTADELAAIHARAMAMPWDREVFAGFLAAKGAILTTSGKGFALGRIAADEVELLALAVDPDQRRQGHARRCLRAFEIKAQKAGANRAFLEVSGENAAAISLYLNMGYARSGLRKGYYRGLDGSRTDAILMEKSLLKV